MLNELKPATRIEKPNYSLRRKMIASLLGFAVLGGAYAIDRGEDFLKNSAHTSIEYKDFSKYNLAKQPEELAKIYEKENIGPSNLDFYTVQGEKNAEEVAKNMGIYNWAEVGDGIISAQVNDPKSKERWTMHSGQTVVVPKDLFAK